MRKGMKQRSLMKRVSVVLMAAALTISTFPQFHINVYAAENQLPTKEQFATAEELKTFDTNDQDGKNPAKVYFGNNDQQWWIAGSQNENVTLFAASPLAENQQFEPNWSQNKTYDSSWNCTYSDGSNPSEVYPNHYGASPLRTTLQGLETSYFTGTEQSLMNKTTIYTNDTKDSSVYSTTDKLYLAYGEFNGSYITVGTNSRDNLNDGLRIDMDCWGNGSVWLRAPNVDHSYRALASWPGSPVLVFDVLSSRALVPAFELNLSSVIFASAAPAATSDGALSVNGAFTLRHSGKDLGSALVSYDKSKVTLTNVPNGTYLVVQNSNGAKAKQITNETEVSASNMGLDSFANCKVWLETTNSNERMTYATLATEEQGYDINIAASDGLTVTNGVQGVGQGSAITDITVEVANGYYLPDGYTDTIQGLNGLNVKDVTQTGFTISGTPTSDVNITLPAATVLPKANIPEVTISKTATSITATVTNHKTEFGNIEYKWNDGNWEQDKNTLSNLQADKTYQLAVRFTGNGFYQMSDEYSIDITTLKDGSIGFVAPSNLTITYKEELKLSDLALPQGWSWENGDTSLSAGTKAYPATFDTTSLESTTDFSKVDGYDKDNHKVTRNVNVIVYKADSQVNITTQTLDKAYDGNAVTTPEYTTSGSDGKVTIKWQENTGTKEQPNWEDLKSAPSTVGTYRVVVELAGNDNYNPASVTLNFVISKATNTWVEEPSITGWTYNENANVPTAKAQFGDVTFTYSSEENGTYTNEVPKNAGTYYVKATVTGTENYTGLESVVSFTIAKADTTLTFEKENIDKTYDKNVISEPKVSKTGSRNNITFAWFVANGNDWTLLDNAPSDVGTYKVVASVNEDSNYNGASIEKEFSISIADNEWTKELSIKDWIYGETASDPSAAAKYGDVVYTYSDSKDGTYTSDVPVNAGTWYVKASVAGTANYTGLESVPVSFEIKKADSSIKFKDGISFDKVYDTNAVIVTEEQVEKTGSTGTVSFTFEKKVNDQWKTVETATEVGTYRVTAILAEDNNHTSATSKPLEFTISKANSVVTITTQSLDKAYDGNAVTTPEYTTSGSNGKVTVQWQEKSMTSKAEWKDLKSAPNKVGTYRVVVELAGNDNYNPASATLNFVISQATNAWTEELSITGWTYNEKVSSPTAKAQFGDVTFTYSSEENGTYTNEVPVNAGTYYVKATVTGTENYTGLESAPVAFEIAKAIPTYEKVTGLVLGQGQPLSKIELPEQFKWVDETMTADELGTHTFKAVYTPEDTANYQTIEVEIEVEVVPTPVELNHVPTISASDKTITVGDKFEPLKDVTSTDKEDGDLTSQIKVINNTVNTKKAGTYEVTYQVTDSQGAIVTKTIKVTVKAVPVNPDTDKPDNGKNDGSVETGDRTNLLLWEVILIGSSIVLLYSLYRKKRKTNQ